MKVWILRRRAIDKMQMDFWTEYAHDMDCAKEMVARMVEDIVDQFNPDVVDMLKFDDWVEDILHWHGKKVEF